MGERSPNRHPLALTGGQRVRQLVQVVGNAEFRSQMLDGPIAFKAEYIATKVYVFTYRKVG